MIITIFASIGSQNLGDELILKNEIKILKLKYSKLKNISEKEIFFNVFTYDIDDIFYDSKSFKFIEYFPIDIKNKKNIFRNIKNFINFIKIVIKSDLIIIGGGGIIYDNENQSVGNPLKQWAFRSKIFKFFNKKVEFFRIGINIKNIKNLDIVKEIFSCASEISVRDNYSFELLKKMNFGDKLKLLIDPVFSDNSTNLLFRSLLNSQRVENLCGGAEFLKGKLNIKELNLGNIKNIFNINKINISGKKIGLSLRDYNIYNYKKNIIEIIKYFLEQKAEIILIPHSFHKTDEKANDYIFLNSCRDVSLKNLNDSELISEGQNSIKICKTMQESYEIYIEKKIDLNLASRLHSIILSQVYGIDFIGISYSKKTDEVLKMLKK